MIWVMIDVYFLQWDVPLLSLLAMAARTRWNKLAIWLKGKKVTHKLHWDQTRTLKYHGLWNIVRLHICYWLLHSQNDCDWAWPLPPIHKIAYLLIFVHHVATWFLRNTLAHSKYCIQPKCKVAEVLSRHIISYCMRQPSLFCQGMQVTFVIFSFVSVQNEPSNTN